MNRWHLAALAAVSLSGTVARAVDQPVDGTKIVLKRSASGSEKLVFLSRDPSALFPTIGSADDPSVGGAVIELFSPAQSVAAVLAVPGGIGVPGWSSHDSAADSYRFTNRDAPAGPSVVKIVSLKQGRVLKVVARATGLLLTTMQGSVGIRITTGSLRNCALFHPTEVRTDVPGTYVARNASAAGLADCSNGSLGGATSTTTLPPMCGNGLPEAGEQCDGSGAFCAAGGLECRPPGISGECTCCSNGGPNTQIVGCCNPSAILIPAPEGAGTCIATRCDLPFDCNPGHECLPDGSCCAPLGETCLGVSYPIPTVFTFPCCPGLECHGPSSAGIGCCVPDVATCAADADCCSQHCTGNTCDACRGGGQPCTNIFECCSLSCTGGTCDACAPAGANCLDNGTCCSGSCTGFVCDP